MSYILDALKKSSEERRKHEAERQQPFPAMEEVASRRRNLRPFSAFFILILVVAATAAATGSWLFFSFYETPGKTADVRNTPAEITHSDAPEAPLVRKTPPLQTGTEQKTAVPLSQVQHPSPALPAETEARERIPPVVKTEPPPVPLLKDLPFGIQSAIPDMKFSGHVYSQTPSRRMIMINTDIVRENEMVSTDLRLLEITEEGLLMEFRGTRFRVELF